MKPSGIRLDYTERLCQIVDESNASLWNNEWLKADSKLYSAMRTVDIIDRAKLATITPIMDEEEIDIFISNYQSNYQG